MRTAIRVAALSALGGLLLGAAWLFLPTALGGGTTYLSTYGTSMEPGFSTGDLAILRPDVAYEVGDVVAYRSEDLGTTVMHRIVDRDGDRFVTQGDNNDFLDQERPSAEQLMGALWLRVPHGGKALEAVSSPAVLALVSAASTVLLVTLRRPRRRRGTKSRRPSPAPRVRFAPSLSAAGVLRARRTAVGAAAVGVVALTGAAALLLLPEEQTVERAVDVTAQGSFTYTGTAQIGTTYPDGLVTTGEPVWTALADALTVSYRHSLIAGGDLDVEGTVRLDVAVAAPDGWSAPLVSGAPVPLQGGTATATVALDTASASGLLSAHYYEVGADGGVATVTVTPVVDVDGTVAGRSLTLPEPAELPFALDPSALRLTGGPETLETSAATSVTVEEIAPRAFRLGPVVLPLETARIAVLGLALAALVVAVPASWLAGRRRTGPAEEFVLRHAGRVLPVAAFVPEGTVVDVADPESLYKLAQKLDGLVLHHAGADGDTFAVRDVGTTYRCVVARPPAAVPARVKAPRRVRTGRLVRRFA